jgi:hypothetical protein
MLWEQRLNLFFSLVKEVAIRRKEFAMWKCPTCNWVEMDDRVFNCPTCGTGLSSPEKRLTKRNLRFDRAEMIGLFSALLVGAVIACLLLYFGSEIQELQSDRWQSKYGQRTFLKLVIVAAFVPFLCVAASFKLLRTKRKND